MEKELGEKITEWKKYAFELKKKMQNEKDPEKKRFLGIKYQKTLNLIGKMENLQWKGF